MNKWQMTGLEGFSFICPFIYSSALFETELFNALKIKAGLTTSKTQAGAWRNCSRVAAWRCSTSKACSRENLSSSRLPCFSFLISRCCSSVSISVSDSRGGLGWVRGWMLCSWHRKRADILEEEKINFEVPVSFHGVVSSELFMTRRHRCCNAVVASKVFSAAEKYFEK